MASEDIEKKAHEAAVFICPSCEGQIDQVLHHCLNGLTTESSEIVQIYRQSRQFKSDEVRKLETKLKQVQLEEKKIAEPFMKEIETLKNDREKLKTDLSRVVSDDKAKIKTLEEEKANLEKQLSELIDLLGQKKEGVEVEDEELLQLSKHSYKLFFYYGGVGSKKLIQQKVRCIDRKAQF
eukprot:Colp12_sorted_trinity150504_noHs@5814